MKESDEQKRIRQNVIDDLHGRKSTSLSTSIWMVIGIVLGMSITIASFYIVLLIFGVLLLGV